MTSPEYKGCLEGSSRSVGGGGAVGRQGGAPAMSGWSMVGRGRAGECCQRRKPKRRLRLRKTTGDKQN
jgi:hypothetical protein